MVRDPLQTKITDMFGVDFPIFGFTHCKDVAAAVTNAGGIGVLGMLGAHPDRIAQEVAWLKDRCGNKPFGIDLVFPANVPEKTQSDEDLDAQIPAEHREFTQRWLDQRGLKWEYRQPEFVNPEGFRGGLSSQEDARKQIDAVLQMAVPLVVAGLGSPAFFIEAAHANGMKVGGLVGKVRQARREIEAGIDMVMAQGYDGGGHTGEIGTFTLVPQVLDIAGDTPVMCAGGVGTGRHLAAALAMGAAGTWSGTLWLASRESDADIMVKEKILAATEEDTMRSKAWSGKPQRGLKVDWNMAWDEPGAPKPLPTPLQGRIAGPAQGALRQKHESNLAYSPAGQVVGAIHEMKSCRDIIYDIAEQARDLLDNVTAPA